MEKQANVQANLQIRAHYRAGNRLTKSRTCGATSCPPSRSSGMKRLANCSAERTDAFAHSQDKSVASNAISGDIFANRRFLLTHPTEALILAGRSPFSQPGGSSVRARQRDFAALHR